MTHLPGTRSQTHSPSTYALQVFCRAVRARWCETKQAKQITIYEYSKCENEKLKE